MKVSLIRVDLDIIEIIQNLSRFPTNLVSPATIYSNAKSRVIPALNVSLRNMRHVRKFNPSFSLGQLYLNHQRIQGYIKFHTPPPPCLWGRSSRGLFTKKIKYSQWIPYGLGISKVKFCPIKGVFSVSISNFPVKVSTALPTTLTGKKIEIEKTPFTGQNFT